MCENGKFENECPFLPTGISAFEFGKPVPKNLRASVGLQTLK